MKPNPGTRPLRILLLTGLLLCGRAIPSDGSGYPNGLMLNMDLARVQDGLVPNAGLYPLHVPLGDLGIETINHESILLLKNELGLDIPHSSLLEPDGSEWIVSVRVAALSDGMVLSQANDVHGYAIYLKNGAAHAVVRTGGSVFLLKETPESGITDCRKDWVSIELRIKPDMALLTLNRKRAAIALLDGPLEGEDMRIRLGNHRTPPAIMQHIPGAPSTGFSGGISSLKIWRQ